MQTRHRVKLHTRLSWLTALSRGEQVVMDSRYGSVPAIDLILVVTCDDRDRYILGVRAVGGVVWTQTLLGLYLHR